MKGAKLNNGQVDVSEYPSLGLLVGAILTVEDLMGEASWRRVSSVAITAATVEYGKLVLGFESNASLNGDDVQYFRHGVENYEIWISDLNFEDGSMCATLIAACERVRIARTDGVSLNLCFARSSAVMITA